MGRAVGLGIQSFEKIRQRRCFYVDKTDFIRKWWENADDVTLITRPRRFGKTLNMSMLEQFLSVEYAGRGEELFGGLAIWKEEKYRKLQGTYPVISLSLADVKETSFTEARKKICQIIENLYNQYDFLLDSGHLNEKEKMQYQNVSATMEKHIASDSLKALSRYMCSYYGKKIIILLDEYDTPMQEAYSYGYWDELSEFIRGLFNSAFKTNPCLDRAVMTGITRVGKESIFSDLNNLTVVTTTSDLYTNDFGFTNAEVYAALTNREVHLMFEQMIDEWFAQQPSAAEPERFYHGFVLGLMVDLADRYTILSNRESGFGRYDVMLEPLNLSDHAYILEFKVRNPKYEKNLEETVSSALAQIKEKKYAVSLEEKGVPPENIRCYGFAFEGKTVRIG